MLTEERYSMILRLLEERGAVSVQELTDILGSSESTIRRDLAALHQEGRLNKVHGGATALRGTYHSEEYPVFVKQEMNLSEKTRIARYAASLISDYDLVFLDAGTTIGCMAEFITAKNVTFITNGLLTAKRLADRGFSVCVTGGRIKSTTEALVGGETLDALRRFHFGIGFFGTNGISLDAGCTTPDMDEARIKTEAIRRCRFSYLLADSSKFGITTSVTFADLDAIDIVTGSPVQEKYRMRAHIIEVTA
ncbi:MAG: DeoR/GlpR family DNA-binding transcription regulator [Intestinibacillus sp.]